MSAPVGHPSYFVGKQIDKSEYIVLWKKISSGEVSRKKVAELLGISVVTVRRWLKETADNMDSDGNIDFDKLRFIK